MGGNKVSALGGSPTWVKRNRRRKKRKKERDRDRDKTMASFASTEAPGQIYSLFSEKWLKRRKVEWKAVVCCNPQHTEQFVGSLGKCYLAN